MTAIPHEDVVHFALRLGVTEEEAEASIRRAIAEHDSTQPGESRERSNERAA